MVGSHGEWEAVYGVLEEMDPGRPHDGWKDQLSSIHAWVHPGADSSVSTLEDEFWESRTEEQFRAFSSSQMYSAAWHLWHTARIEDITLNHLIYRRDEILDAEGHDLGPKIPRHTGNSMNRDDMEKFNRHLDLEALRRYRRSVTEASRKAIEDGFGGRLGSAIDPLHLESISERGSVAPEDGGLLRFWGSNGVIGIVGMPMTRHPYEHLKRAFEITAGLAEDCL